MKTRFLLVLWVGCVFCAHAQDPYKTRVDYIFGSLNQAEINSGILTDYGLSLIDHTLYDGVIRTNNAMDMLTWRTLYGTLLASVINPSATLLHIKEINTRMDNLQVGYSSNNPIIDLPVMYARYQTLRTDAVTANLLKVQNEKLLDVAGRTQSPYLTKYAFAVSPSQGFDADGKVTFMFRSNLFVNTSGRTFSTFQVDFGDGKGYQTVTQNVAKNITYTTAGVKTIKFKMQFTDGTIVYNHAKFDVLEVPSPATRYANPSQAYRFPRSTDIGCPENFPNPRGTLGGLVTVAYGGTRTANPGCNPQFIRPLIVVEGYDVYKFITSETNYEYRNLINGSRNGGLAIPFDAGRDFNQALQDAGYDLIFLDFNEGTGDIVQNALLLENVIEWVNAHKASNAQQNVVMGYSMGALVARYALADMEKRRIASTAYPDHQTRLFISQDGPHRGANVPLGFQMAVNQLYNFKLTKIGLATYGVVGAIVGSFLELGDIVKPLREAKKLLDEPASQQMLLLQDGRNNTFLNGAYRTMITFATGYTPHYRMVAIANGSECGTGQPSPVTAYSELLKVDANLYLNRRVYGVATSIVSGTLTAAGSLVGMGNVIGPVVTSLLHLVAPLTGKNWKTKFIINALPDPAGGSRRIFYGKFGFEKKILYLIPVNITLWEKSLNSPTGALAWDSAPGGYYNLRNIQSNIPGNPNINAFPIVEANFEARLAPQFNFVPTVSALDITNLTAAALTAQYTNGTSPGNASRFNNFITQERDGSIFNTNHVLFTTRNSNWIFNVMQSANTNPIPTPANCTATCTLNPTITGGAASVCNGYSTTFSINSVAGYTAQWSVSSNLRIMSQTATSIAVQALNSSVSGNATLDAVLVSAGGCRVVAARRNIWVGAPTIPSNLYVDVDQELCVNGSAEFYVVNTNASITNYVWGVSGASVLYGQGTSRLGVHVQNTDVVTVDVEMGNNCSSTTSAAGGEFEVTCNNNALMVYPIPADDQLIIELATVPEENTNLSELKITPQENSSMLLGNNQAAESFSIILYNEGQEVVATAVSENAMIQLGISALPEGAYFLHIYYKGKIKQRQIRIE